MQRGEHLSLLERVRGHARLHVVAVLVASVVLVLLLQLVPSDGSLTGDLARAAACCVVVGAAFVLTGVHGECQRPNEPTDFPGQHDLSAPGGSDPTGALVGSGKASVAGQSSEKPLFASVPLLVVGCLAVSAVGFVLAAAFVDATSISTVALEGASAGNQPQLFFPLVLVLFLLVCVAVGFFEEGLFRVILPWLFERGFTGNGMPRPRADLYAVLLSAAIFGFLHLSAMPDIQGSSQVVAAQTVLKFLQGMCFGMAMSLLLRRVSSIAFLTIVHACYDMVVFLPWLLSTGALPSAYITGAAADTWALAASAVALVPSAVACIPLLLMEGAGSSDTA